MSSVGGRRVSSLARETFIAFSGRALAKSVPASSSLLLRELTSTLAERGIIPRVRAPDRAWTNAPHAASRASRAA